MCNEKTSSNPDQDIQMAKHMNSGSLFREMKIETTWSYHLTAVNVYNKKETASVVKDAEKGTLLHCWECRLVQPLRKPVGRFLKVNLELPYDTVIPVLGIYPKKGKH